MSLSLKTEKYGDQYFISKSELKNIIEESFRNGYRSYNEWKGQPDTCWLNVEQDLDDYVDELFNNLDEIQTIKC